MASILPHHQEHHLFGQITRAYRRKTKELHSSQPLVSRPTNDKPNVVPPAAAQFIMQQSASLDSSIESLAASVSVLCTDASSMTSVDSKDHLQSCHPFVSDLPGCDPTLAPCGPPSRPKLKIATDPKAKPKAQQTSASGLNTAVTFIHYPTTSPFGTSSCGEPPVSALNTAVTFISYPTTSLPCASPRSSTFPPEFDASYNHPSSKEDASGLAPLKEDDAEDTYEAPTAHASNKTDRPVPTYAIKIDFSSADISTRGGDVACNNRITVNDCQEVVNLLSLDRLPYTKSALFENISDRALRPACIEGTRVDILRGLVDWAVDPSSPNVCWMSGMAGTGKTTISQSLAEELHRKKLLAATFFCTGIHEECTKAENIIPTLAVQLSRTDEAFAAGLSQVLREHPDAGSHCIDHQFKDLIITPLSCAKPKGLYKLVIIDALDECISRSGIEALLQAICGSASERLPLKFFISSHPTQAVRTHLERRAHSIALHDVEEHIVSSDIAKYITTTLLRFAANRHLTDYRWPPAEKVQILVQRAHRLFIYAATVCRYIGKAVDIFEAFTDVTSDSFAPRDIDLDTETIDSLYRGILAKAFEDLNKKDRQRLQQILSLVISMREPLSLRTFASLLKFNTDDPARTTHLCLRLLESVVVVPPLETPERMVSTFHPSFPEFLVDSTRSLAFHVDTAHSHRRIASTCLELLNSKLCRNICQLAEDVPNMTLKAEIIHKHVDEATRYSALHWLSHLESTCEATGEDSLDEKLRAFVNDHLLHWLECLSILRRLSVAQTSLAVLDKLLQKQDAQLREKISNAKTMVDNNFDAISRCWYEIYRPSLDSTQGQLAFTTRDDSDYVDLKANLAVFSPLSPVFPGGW